ncbi:putative LPXTG-motif protein cell wall anchor domain protein [Corynebacterium sp. DNF00584]|nr:putative LPXTG-motif protein cell wall anchor domain protein [Corynebacterium sp. DNF00584]
MQNQVSKRFIGRRAAAVVAAGLVGVGALAPVAEAQQVYPAGDERVVGRYWPSPWFPKESIDAVMADLREGEKVEFKWGSGTTSFDVEPEKLAADSNARTLFYALSDVPEGSIPSPNVKVVGYKSRNEGGDMHYQVLLYRPEDEPGKVYAYPFLSLKKFGYYEHRTCRLTRNGKNIEFGPSASAFSGGGSGGGSGGSVGGGDVPDWAEDENMMYCDDVITDIGSLSGTVVWDEDTSHTVTDPDTRIGGHDVVLTRGGVEVARTQTDENGFYKFEYLAQGKYGISVEAPDGGVLLFFDERGTVNPSKEDKGNNWGFLKKPEPTTVTQVTTATKTTTVTPPAKTTTLPAETVTTTVENPPVTVTSTPERATDTVTETPEPSTATVTKTPEKETVTKTPEKVTETATVTKTPEKETVTKTPEVKTVTATPPTVTVTPEKVTETVTFPPKTVTQKEPAVTVTKAPETETVTAAPEKVTETVTVAPEVTEPAPELGGFTGTVVWDNDGSKSASDGDERISGLTVIARRDGKEIARTTTDENGFYTFEGLAPGDYDVEVVGPDGARLGFDDRKATVAPGETDSGNDWGFVREDAPAPAPEEKPATPVETVRMTLATTGANSYALAGLGAVLAALVALAVVGRRKSASQ